MGLRGDPDEHGRPSRVIMWVLGLLGGFSSVRNDRYRSMSSIWARLIYLFLWSIMKAAQSIPEARVDPRASAAGCPTMVSAALMAAMGSAATEPLRAMSARDMPAWDIVTFPVLPPELLMLSRKLAGHPFGLSVLESPSGAVSGPAHREAQSQFLVVDAQGYVARGHGCALRCHVPCQFRSPAPGVLRFFGCAVLCFHPSDSFGVSMVPRVG